MAERIAAATATALATGLGAVPVSGSGPAQVFGGAAAGVLFLLGARSWLDRSDLPVAASGRTSLLVFGVLLVHSLPEGFAIGAAYASTTEGLGLFIVAAIAVQNIPEGTSVAIPMSAAGYGAARQFWAAVASSAPQPVGAVIAYLLVEQVTDEHARRWFRRYWTSGVGSGAQVVVNGLLQVARDEAETGQSESTM